MMTESKEQTDSLIKNNWWWEYVSVTEEDPYALLMHKTQNATLFHASAGFNLCYLP